MLKKKEENCVKQPTSKKSVFLIHSHYSEQFLRFTIIYMQRRQSGRWIASDKHTVHLQKYSTRALKLKWGRDHQIHQTCRGPQREQQKFMLLVRREQGLLFLYNCVACSSILVWTATQRQLEWNEDQQLKLLICLLRKENSPSSVF